MLLLVLLSVVVVVVVVVVVAVVVSVVVAARAVLNRGEDRCLRNNSVSSDVLLLFAVAPVQGMQDLARQQQTLSELGLSQLPRWSLGRSHVAAEATLPEFS